MAARGDPCTAGGQRGPCGRTDSSTSARRVATASRGALARPGPNAMYLPTAALVLEIISPGDETWEKRDFYAAHRVEELLIVDPQERKVSWLGLASGEYKRQMQSRLIELGANELAAQIDWP